MPCIEKFTEANKRRSTGQQPGTKSAHSPSDKPRINRLSTGCQPRVLFFHLFPYEFLFVCFRRDINQSCIRCPGVQEGRLTLGPIKPSVSRFTQLCPAPPPCRAPPKPTRLLYVWVLDITSVLGESLRGFVFDALGGTRDACPLCDLFCRRPVLPDPAPPPRRAPRPDPPVVCSVFELDK